jgi:hypothetical protein
VCDTIEVGFILHNWCLRKGDFDLRRWNNIPPQPNMDRRGANSNSPAAGVALKKAREQRQAIGDGISGYHEK